MKFNLENIYEENGREYGERLKDLLFSKVSNNELLKYYIPGEGIKYKNLCVFHKESSPSMCVDLTRGIFKCFGCGSSGDGLLFIQKKYNCTFIEALKIALNDFGIYTHNKAKVPLELLGISPKHDKSIETLIKIKSRDWLQKDILFWKQFNISKELCIRFSIYPISHYWVNQHCFTIKSGDLSYGFYEQGKFQIYQPYASKDRKWFSNTGSMIYGFEQLPLFGKLLFITSSKKDILTLTSLGYNAVSPNNEGSKLPEDKYEELNNRFDKIVIYFNNDYQGLKAAHTMSEELGLNFIYNPLDCNFKDPSDYCKFEGEEKLRVIIKKLLNESIV